MTKSMTVGRMGIILAFVVILAAFILGSLRGASASGSRQDIPVDTPTPDPFLATPTVDFLSVLPTPDPALVTPAPVVTATQDVGIQAPIDVTQFEVTATPVPITLEQLREAALIVPSISATGTVQLSGGRFTSEATGLSVVLSDTLTALGDINGDGSLDAAVILEVAFGESTRYDLVFVTNQGTLPVAVAGVSLGDGAAVDRLRIESGGVWVDLRVPGPGDEACCPTVPVERLYLLRGTGVVEVPASAYGRLFPFPYGPRYGYVNILGEIVIQPAYVYADDFHEGLALVSLDGESFGFVNRLGQTAIPLDYRFATPFDAGMAVVGLTSDTGGDTVAYIDQTGRNIFGEKVFASGQPFSDGVAAVQTEAGKYGYIDLSGGEAISATFDFALPFSEGLAAVLQGEQVGYINRHGDVIIEAKFDAGDTFSEGVAAVALSGTVGYVDHRGVFEVQPQFEKGDRFAEGLAAVTLDSMQSFVNHDGESIASEVEFSDASHFTEGLAAVKVGELYGYMNQRGEVAIAPQFTRAGDFDNGLASVETEAHWGIIDPTGAWLVQLSLRPELKAVAPVTGTFTDTTQITGTLPITPVATAPPATEIVTFVPGTPDEIRPGQCYSSSDLVEGEAWRCGVGSDVFDPCLLAVDGTTVVCGFDPLDTEKPGFVLELTQPLPPIETSKVLPGAWIFQLESGAVCRYVSGTSITIEGERVNYTCSDLSQLLGEIDKSGASGWTVNVVSATDDGEGNYSVESLTPAKILRSWQPVPIKAEGE